MIDLKIGTKTWEDDAPKEKIERESKKYPLQRTIGFRLTGMRVFNTDTKEYDVYDKKYGYAQTESTLPTLFATFFSHIPSQHRVSVIQSVIAQLKPILAWFEGPGHMQFICSSLLFIFEGDATETFNPVVKLVDFAHVKALDADHVDEGCIVGIRRILRELEGLVRFSVSSSTR